ncbi:DUF6525 family protein [Celeribacter sp.]|uniref:DUF6525 family protein n=1 Tax=Celeribacter sp. TaxID=1890673 RepID=UPI003A8EA75A
MGGCGGMSNLNTSLRKRRRSNDPMREFDRLPRPLRLWLMEAALPWSPRSVRRLWAGALTLYGGCEERALAHLSRIEAQRLAKDAYTFDADGTT